MSELRGSTFNVGGGAERSLSLCETTEWCEKISGRRVAMGSVEETRVADVKTYISDNTRVAAATGWKPKRSPEQALRDIHAWIRANEAMLRPVLAAD